MDQSPVGSCDETQKRKQWRLLSAPAIAGGWHPVREEIHQGEDEPAGTHGSQSRDARLTRGSNVKASLDSYICTKPGY